jgi:hypothetical protein
MLNQCGCIQKMPNHLYDGWAFFEGYKAAIGRPIPKDRALVVNHFIFKLRDFLIGASQNNHGVVTLQNRGEHWILLKGENNSPYQLINSEFEAYVRPALLYLKEQYTCGWDQSDALVTMVVKKFFFAGR